ncbi:transcriptional repressor [Anaerobutyricum hallii]|nr:transcriptional repressor [Anaerobutyricum hallii]
MKKKEISVNTTTVYRLLDKLCAENIIIKYSDINSDKAVYQYAGEKGHCREHLHLKCIKCGKVMHLDCGFMDELREHIMEEHHFQLQCSGDLLHGLCEECAKNSDF